MPDTLKPGIIKVGNAGMITATGGTDLLHTMPLASTPLVTGARSAVITKIMAYNNTGANVTLLLGTLDRQAVPAFVQLLPTLTVVNAFDNEWDEDDIPAVEWISNTSLLAAGRNGNIYMQTTAGVIVLIEVREFGA